MEADDFMVSDKILTRLIEEVNTGRIRRIAVGKHRCQVHLEGTWFKSEKNRHQAQEEL